MDAMELEEEEKKADGSDRVVVNATSFWAQLR